MEDRVVITVNDKHLGKAVDTWLNFSVSRVELLEYVEELTQ
jgi:hypothetical protein